jgi:hypothetical protein
MSTGKNDIVTSSPFAEDGWESVLDEISAKDAATGDERMRCVTIVEAEIESGRLRGVPETAGVMIILHRIAAAISNG